ncbi:MAG: EamA family transporter [bacterium]|nr:EamA family transporter [bacterium]
MNWLTLTVIAIIARATYSLATRVLSRDIHASSITHTFLLTVSTGILTLLFNPLIGGLNFNGVNNHFLLLGFIIATSVGGNIVYFVGQKKLDTGTTQIAFSSILIWGGFLSVIFLKSTFSMTQSIGMVILLSAILIAQVKKDRVRLNQSVLYIILSAMLFALFQVGSAQAASTISTGTYLVIISFGTAITILLFYSKTIKADFYILNSQVQNTFLKTLFASGTSALYLIFSFLAYKNAPDSGVVVVLLTSQVIVSVIFGIIFLKEREKMGIKLLAGLLAVIAGLLITS